MFTGITTHLGVIKKINNKKKNEYIIRSNMNLSKVKIGSSILCSGICLTVVKKSKDTFTTNISEETLKITNAKSWVEGTKLNLERSLKLGDELGGHIVTGHIDRTSELADKKVLKKSIVLSFKLPSELKKFICRKGSITIDGISLTVNKVDKKKFLISLIPHTANVTTLGYIEKGQKVNLEIDVLARYVDNNINIR